MTKLIAALKEEAELWRGLAFLFALSLRQYDSMTDDEKAVCRARIDQLTPEVLRLPWEPKLPDNQTPQWAIDLLGGEV